MIGCFLLLEANYGGRESEGKETREEALQIGWTERIEEEASLG